MGIWSRLAGALRGGRKYSSIDLFRDVFGTRVSDSGQVVSIDTALQVSAVLACVRCIAQGVAQVPWRVHLKEGTARRVAEDHPLDQVIHRTASRWQSGFELRETMLMHAALTGRALAVVYRVGIDRRVAEIVPVPPHRWRIERKESDGITFVVQVDDDGGEIRLGPGDVWHLRGPSWNGWQGVDLLGLARNAVGLAMATEASHSGLHRNGLRAAGAYTIPEAISPEQFAELGAWLDRYAVGGEREQKALILSNGAKFEPFQMSGVDAQHLETRRYQVEEVCRVFGVMPIMVGYSDKASTYASAEQMFLAHVIYTLGPWFARIEQSADAALLSAADRAAGYYTKLNAAGLMRGAARDRADFYAKALGAGGHPAWMTADEVRGLEELDPRGGAADTLSPGAMGGTTGAEGTDAAN